MTKEPCGISRVSDAEGRQGPKAPVRPGRGYGEASSLQRNSGHPSLMLNHPPPVLTFGHVCHTTPRRAHWFVLDARLSSALVSVHTRICRPRVSTHTARFVHHLTYPYARSTLSKYGMRRHGERLSHPSLKRLIIIIIFAAWVN